MSETEIQDLSIVDTNNFQQKEQIALKYAYEWAAADGKAPEGDFVNEYEEQYSTKERARLTKLMRLMQFSNYFSNMLYRKPWKEG